MRTPWPPILFVGCVLGALVGRRIPALALDMPDPLLAMVAAGMLGVISVSMIATTILAMRRARTEIRPDRPAIHLLTAGIFRLTRNPIYEGEFYLLLAIASFRPSLAGIFAVILFFLVINRLIALEERHLDARFGVPYAEYRAHVPRFGLFGLGHVYLRLFSSR
jgi:protein-S-isoprenylcysteine O-methyltransferase Ste14